MFQILNACILIVPFPSFFLCCQLWMGVLCQIFVCFQNSLFSHMLLFLLFFILLARVIWKWTRIFFKSFFIVSILFLPNYCQAYCYLQFLDMLNAFSSLFFFHFTNFFLEFSHCVHTEPCVKFHLTLQWNKTCLTSLLALSFLLALSNCFSICFMFMMHIYVNLWVFFHLSDIISQWNCIVFRNLYAYTKIYPLLSFSFILNS